MQAMERLADRLEVMARLCSRPNAPNEVFERGFIYSVLANEIRAAIAETANE